MRYLALTPKARIRIPVAKRSRSAAQMLVLCTSHLPCADAGATPTSTCRLNCCTTARVRALFSLCLFYSFEGKVESAELLSNYFRAGASLLSSWFHVGSTCVHDSKSYCVVQHFYVKYKLPPTAAGCRAGSDGCSADGCREACRRVQYFYCFLVPGYNVQARAGSQAGADGCSCRVL